MKRTARGLTRPEGREPALSASTPSPPWMRANASAIWLRFEFSTHTKSTRFLAPTTISAATRLRRATGPALGGFRRDAGDVRAAGGAVGRAGGVVGVVGGGFAEGVEGFPARALRILGPKLVRLRVAADRRLLRDHGAAGSVEAAAERGQRLAAVRLDAEMVDAGRAAGVRDREVHARILEHPLGVVVLAHGGLGAEQLGVEADARRQVGDIEVDVEAVHGRGSLFRGVQVPAGPQSAAPAQQFSVR